MSTAKENTVNTFDSILTRVENLCDNLPDDVSTSVTQFCEDLADEINSKFPVVYAVCSEYLKNRDDMEVTKGPGGGLRRKTESRVAAKAKRLETLATREANRLERAARKAEKDAARAAKKFEGSANAFAQPVVELSAEDLQDAE